ncbi:hypothetical protein TNCV_2804471 [Trichonephila clavipes]|nr:hypothetical protein TNCV_2804471 [Trichonephila clavipes]
MVLQPTFTQLQVHRIVECVVRKGVTRERHFCHPLSLTPYPPKEKPVGKATKEFKESGIEPHNHLVFSEHDYAAAKTTNHDVVGDATEIHSANPQTLVVENQHINSLGPGWALSQFRSTSGPRRHFGVNAFT